MKNLSTYCRTTAGTNFPASFLVENESAGEQWNGRGLFSETLILKFEQKPSLFEKLFN